MSTTEEENLIKKLTTHTLPLYENECPIMFFWSPRSGCTSLIKWFFFQVGLLQEAIDYNPWIHLYRMEVYENKENYKNEILKQLLERKKDTYKLIRNPYKRAVSSFLATLSNEIIMNEVAPNNREGLSFKQFLYNVKNIGISRDLINSHIAQQYIDEEEFFIENYVKLENFNTEIKYIENKYNLLNSPMLNITNSSHHMSQRMVEKGAFADHKLTLEPYNKPLPTYESFYDKETKDLVKELFKEDFEKYKYNKEDLS